MIMISQFLFLYLLPLSFVCIVSLYDCSVRPFIDIGQICNFMLNYTTFENCVNAQT
jgi:hypothetical protein